MFSPFHPTYQVFKTLNTVKSRIILIRKFCIHVQIKKSLRNQTPFYDNW